MDDNEKNIIEKIKEISNSLQVPETLEAENMMKKLKEQEQDKESRKYGRIPRPLVVFSSFFLMIIIFAGAYYLHYQKEDNNNIKLTESGAKESISTASSYQEIYELLNKSQVKQGTKYSMEYGIGNSALTEDTASGNTSNDEADFSSTNIQVKGVDEGDVVKTDGSYIYILEPNNHKVRIMDTSGEQLKETSQIPITYKNGQYGIPCELYVKNNSLMVIYNIYGNYDSSSASSSTNESTVIETYDISDRSQPKIKGSVNQEGYYSSSRMVGDYIYLFSSCTKYYTVLEEDNCTPYVNGEPVEPQQVYLTDDIDSPSYNVITAININSPSDYSCVKTILGNYSQLYVSTNNIYFATNVFTQNNEKGQNETEIIKLTYQDGNIEGVATARVNGLTENSFSLDEYNGNLRLVTTVSTYNTVSQKNSASSNSIMIDSRGQTSNNLYILGEKLNLLGKIENLAPEEQIYSARFMGNTGYFVTFKNIDPLFSVDLSDPENPKILGELKITGFSEYLHFWSDNLLLGIGKEVNPETNETIGLKLSMFDISNPSNVTEIHKTVLENYSDSYVDVNHKAILVDNEKNLIGFIGLNGTGEDYFIYQYNDQEGFTLKLQKKIQTVQKLYDNSSYIRGLYIKDKFYLAQPGEKIIIFNLDNFLLTGEYPLQ